MAAGTGGHIMPGLAVAQEMQSRGWTVSWLGTAHGMENRLVPPTGLPLDTLNFRGLRGKGLLGTLRGSVQLVQALWDSSKALRARRADAVLGMGGYVCFPGGLAAKWRGLPLMLVNADAALLLSNRSLLRWADRIAFGFAGGAQAAGGKALVTGNPVRAVIEALPAPEQRFQGRSGPLKLLVVGGSLGAQALNQLLPAALALLPAEQRPQVRHQTGAAHLEGVQAAYGQAGVSALVQPFIDDMAQALAEADVVVARAGAITVSELCAAGVASILVPLIVSTTSHQRDNAQWLAEQGAAWHEPQASLTPKRLAERLQGLDRPGLLAMASQARRLAQPRAAARVADELQQLVSQAAARSQKASA